MIDTSDALKSLVDRARKAQAIALDTEFVWEQTYYPKLGLVQIGLSDTDCHLVDMQAMDDLSALGDLIADAHVVKILHDAHQDLWILKRVTGASPINVFDTRSAAGFAGMSATLSLGNLLHTCLDVQLPKTETRTNWLQRPLSDQQRAYALDDVRYLPALRDHLIRAIQRRGREDWLNEEFGSYDAPDLYEDRNPEEQYLRVKGTGRLSRHELAVVRELAAWRERESRSRDVPRNRVIGDGAIVQIARRKPHSARALQRISALPQRNAQRDGDALIEAAKRGLMLDERDCPPALAPMHSNPFHDARLDLAMAFLRGRCLSGGIDISLVASRAEVKDLISNGHVPSENRLLSGWRNAFLGADLTELLAGKHAIAVDPETHVPELLREP